MIFVIRKRAKDEEVEKMSKHFKGFIKVVVDVDKEILCGGADRHSNEERKLLELGSTQVNLWGGGVDMKTKEVDYNSVINLRPNQDNPSRDILSLEVRTKFDKVIKNLLL